MGCNHSSGTLQVSKEMSKMDLNSNNQIESKEEKPEEDEAAVLGRFTETFMTHLQTLAGKPPMMPTQLLADDPRLILVPAIFHCTQTLEELEKTPMPSDSHMIITYLKSGTHWLWEITKMLKKGKATSDGMPKEMAHLEFFPPSVLKSIHGRDVKIFATHFPLWTLPKSSYSNHKHIYAYRNPKDVCVSFYFHYLNMSAANPKDFPKIEFDQAFEMFLGPSEANIMGNWFDHVADYWDHHREDPNILCVSYEDMKKDPENEIRRIDKHIGTNASEQLIKDITKETSFAKMKKDKESSEQHLSIVFKGTMYRKGEVGDWKNYMSEEQSNRIDKLVAEWQSARAEPVPLTYEL